MIIHDLQPFSYIVVSLAFSVGTSSIFLGLYCRAILLRTFGWDDFAPIFLFLSLPTNFASECQMTRMLKESFPAGEHDAAINTIFVFASRM